MSGRTGDHHMTILIVPTKDAKGVRAVTAAKTKGAIKAGGKPTPWTLELERPGLTWVGSQYVTHERDDDPFDMLHVFGYVTDGTHFAIVDFLEDRPTPNLRPQFMLKPTLTTIRFGKRHPDGAEPAPPRRGKK